MNNIGEEASLRKSTRSKSATISRFSSIKVQAEVAKVTRSALQDKLDEHIDVLSFENLLNR